MNAITELQLSRDAATEIGQSIDELLGNGNWVADNPFPIHTADSEKNQAYEYEIRKGSDWITIKERAYGDHSSVKRYMLRKRKNKWEYIDPCQIEDSEFSLPELQALFSRLKLAVEALKSN